MSLADRALNRLLADEPWARQRLAAHAGRRFMLEVGPARQAFTIAADGTLTDEPSADSRPDLRLTLSALAV
ncbi:MAG: SCP2 sterol-binding domain-containing protein, partial [Casimicrobiaceae bacterium]